MARVLVTFICVSLSHSLRAPAVAPTHLAPPGGPMPFGENQGAKIYWDEQGSGEPRCSS